MIYSLSVYGDTGVNNSSLATSYLCWVRSSDLPDLTGLKLYQHQRIMLFCLLRFHELPGQVSISVFIEV